MINFSSKFVQSTIAALGLWLALPLASFAGFFGEHPHYLHALSDIRYARTLIERPDAPNVVADERNAVVELDASISELKQAALDDWKPVADMPPVDASLDRRGRLRQALEVLGRARNDMSQEEDNAAARGWRNRAVSHLDQAINFVRRAIGDQHMDRAMESNMESNLESNLESNMDLNRERNIERNIDRNIEQNIYRNAERGL